MSLFLTSLNSGCSGAAALGPDSARVQSFNDFKSADIRLSIAIPTPHASLIFITAQRSKLLSVIVPPK